MFSIGLLSALVGSLLAAWTSNWLGLIPWRRSAGAPWPERARVLFPVWGTAIFNRVYITVCAVFILQYVGGDMARHWVVSALAAWFGASLGSYAIHREIWPDMSLRQWHRQFVTSSLYKFTFGWLVWIAAIIFMPAEIGWETLVIAMGMLAYILLLNFGWHLRLLRWFGLVRPAPENIRAIAAAAATAARVPLHGVWMCDGPVAQALAFPFTGDIVVTEPLERLLTPDEMYAICAHEAAHLAEPRAVRVTRLLTSLMLYPVIFVRPVAESSGLTGISAVFALFFVLRFWFLQLGKRMEIRADAHAANDAAAATNLGRALEKLYENNQMPVVMPKRSGQIHPSLYDRMLAAGLQPSYDRPAAPAQYNWSILVFLMLAIALQIALFVKYTPEGLVKRMTIS